jgi:hypothetical protein
MSPSPSEITLYGIAFIVGGPLLALLLVGMAVRARRRAAAAYTWPTTRGIVIASSVKSTSNRGSYAPKITYRYQVAGQTYESAVMSRNFQTGGPRNIAQAKADEYPVGRQVDVRYDPEKPQEAVLELVTPAVWWLYLLAGLSLFMGVTGGAVFLARGAGVF